MYVQIVRKTHFLNEEMEIGMKTIIESKKLNKFYSLNKSNKQHVLKNIDIKIMQGEFVSVMGASGCGKSTLLYSMSSMEKMSSGHLLFDGYDYSVMCENELSCMRLEKMGFIFQHSGLLKNLNIMDNIIFPSYVRQQEQPSIINERAFDLMNKVGIYELAEKYMNQVSGGQLQRAAICRALMNRPAIIFADEPTGALDFKSSADVMKILAKENEEGTTIMLVTHDAHVAAKTEKVFFMRDGTIAGEFYQEKWNGNYQDLAKREENLHNWLVSVH